MEAISSKVLVGIGGWEHESFDGLFYPAQAADSLHRLSLLASVFDFTEVRASFWDDSLCARDATEWAAAAEVNRRFRFVVKLHRSFTHKRILTPAGAKNARSLLHDLSKRERLGGLLMQFPYNFTNTSSSRFHLTRLSEIFRGFPLFAEVRHSSWDQESLGEFMEEIGLRLVNVDLPRLRQYISCRSDAAEDMTYLRLHGRNEKGWVMNHPDARYDYLYNGPELVELKRRVERLALKSGRVFVSCNNTTMGKALVNAFQLTAALNKERKQRIPAPLVRQYPVLMKLASVVEGQEELPIFGAFRDVV